MSDDGADARREPDPPHVREDYRDVWLSGWRAGQADARLVAPVEPLADSEREELERLRALVNTPEIEDFGRAVVLEAAHQRERWGDDHDAQKTDADWFWTIGYLAGKALHGPLSKDMTDMAMKDINDESDAHSYVVDKQLHRIITIAACAANWHRIVMRRDNREAQRIAAPPEGTLDLNAILEHALTEYNDDERGCVETLCEEIERLRAAAGVHPSDRYQDDAALKKFLQLTHSSTNDREKGDTVHIKEELKIMLDRLRHLHEHHIEHEATADAVGQAITAIEHAHATAPEDLQSSKTVADPHAPPPENVVVDPTAITESGVKGTATLGDTPRIDAADLSNQSPNQPPQS